MILTFDYQLRVESYQSFGCLPSIAGPGECLHGIRPKFFRSFWFKKLGPLKPITLDN